PLVFADGSFQHSCFRFPGLWQALLDVAPLPARLAETRLNGRYARAAYTRPMAIDHPLGACFALRRTGLLFDESYFMYAEEIDLCWRLRQAGWTIAYLPELTVLHHAGQSTRQVPLAMRRQLYRSRALFNRKHRGAAFNLAWRLLVRAGGAPLQ
ncbi:MAG: glycosyltransferase family 2 protein, partial [Chloroflexota bacterium]